MHYEEKPESIGVHASDLRNISVYMLLISHSQWGQGWMMDARMSLSSPLGINEVFSAVGVEQAAAQKERWREGEKSRGRSPWLMEAVRPIISSTVEGLMHTIVGV